MICKTKNKKRDLSSMVAVEQKIEIDYWYEGGTSYYGFYLGIDTGTLDPETDCYLSGLDQDDILNLTDPVS